jgi:hypothetical protein
MADDIHRAIVGGVGSGKTYYCQQTARAFKQAGIGVLVLHKPREPWPAASWQTDDPERFKTIYWKAKRCACFMELADADVSKYDGDFVKMFTLGRHEGNRNFYISQYSKQVHPVIRMNCSSLVLFATHRSAAKMWAEEFNDDELLKACQLPPRWFYLKRSRYTPAELVTLGA